VPTPSSVAADVTSPGEPGTRGAAAPTSGPLSTSVGSGTAAGDPLSGVDAPTGDPVYPAGADPTPGGVRP